MLLHSHDIIILDQQGVRHATWPGHRRLWISGDVVCSTCEALKPKERQRHDEDPNHPMKKRLTISKARETSNRQAAPPDRQEQYKLTREQAASGQEGPDRDARIRRRAHEMREAEGRPEGQARLRTSIVKTPPSNAKALLARSRPSGRKVTQISSVTRVESELTQEAAERAQRADHRHDAVMPPALKGPEAYDLEKGTIRTSHRACCPADVVTGNILSCSLFLPIASLTIDRPSHSDRVNGMERYGMASCGVRLRPVPYSPANPPTLELSRRLRWRRPSDIPI